MTFAWHLAILGLKIPPYLMPSPVMVLKAFTTKWNIIALHAGYTLSSAALGLCFSLALAIGLAVAFTASRNLADAVSPIVIAFRSMPVTAIAPIITLALGRGMATSVVVVAIVTFFPLLVNLRKGLTNSSPECRRAAPRLHGHSVAAPEVCPTSLLATVPVFRFARGGRERNSWRHALRMDHGIARPRQSDPRCRRVARNCPAMGGCNNVSIHRALHIPRRIGRGTSFRELASINGPKTIHRKSTNEAAIF